MNNRNICRLLTGLIFFAPAVLTKAGNPTRESNPAVVIIDEQLRVSIREALHSNPQVLSLQYQADAAEKEIRSAGTWQDPTLSFGLMNLPANSFDFNREPMTGAWITVSQAIPMAGKPAIRTEIARAEWSAVEQSRLSTELLTVEKIAHTWFDWAYLGEALRTLDVNISLLDDMVAAAMRKYETGTGLQQDILRAETRRTRLEDMRLKTHQTSVTIGRQFAALLGRNPDSAPSPPESLLNIFPELSYESLFRQLFDDNPAWLSVKAALNAADNRVRLAESNWYPDLKLSASYGFRQNADNGSERPDFVNFTAGTSIPIYGKRKQDADIQKMHAQRRAMLAKQRSTELELRFRLEALIDEDKRLSDQVILFLEGVEPQAEAALVASRSSYAAGKSDFESVLMAETALYDAQLDRLARIRDRQKIRASLAVLAGGTYLLQDLKTK